MSIIITLPNRDQAILDCTLAEQFGTVTKEVNKSRSRNPERFPDERFAFQLTKLEIDLLRFQFGTSIENQLFSGFFERQPWAYTEIGVGQIAGILSTPEAVEASVRVMLLFRDTRASLQRLANAVLANNPTWRQIVRYKGLGLNHGEIGRLVGIDRSTVRKHVRELEACGLLAPPRALPMMQQMTLQFDGGVA